MANTSDVLNGDKKFLLTILIICIIITVGVGIHKIFLSKNSPTSSNEFSKEIDYIRKNITVVLPQQNRTLYLDINLWYCKYIIFYGGSNTHPQDLYPPGAQIAFFFLEDLNEPLADNYSDTIIRMNPVMDDGTLKMCCVFFCEGGYNKLIYYNDQLLHEYIWDDTNKTSYCTNYGIRLIDLEGFDC